MTDKSDNGKGITAAVVVGAAAIAGIAILARKKTPSDGNGPLPESKFSNLTAVFS